MAVLCESGGGMQKCIWAPEQNLAKYGRKTRRWMEMLLPGAGCPGLMAGCPGGRAGCPGSGSVDERDEHCMERSNPGKFGGICG